jgi:hypothetical protein
MSIQAVAWALEQNIPARPKLVLVAIANHADHTDGYCWLRAETIASEAACSPRGVFNFVGDLIRNGYLRKQQRKGDDNKQRANDYWILFHREAAEWIKDRAPGEPDDDDVGDADTTTSGEPDAPGACGSACGQDAVVLVENAPGAVGPHAPACSRKDSEEPSKTNLQRTEPEASFARAPRSYAPPPVAPEIQGATHKQTNERVFVIKGTRAWDAWMAYRRDVERKNGCNTYRQHIEGVGHREGWDFPSLFPPRRETGQESGEQASGADPPSQKPA